VLEEKSRKQCKNYLMSSDFICTRHIMLLWWSNQRV